MRALTIDNSTSFLALRAIKNKVHSVCGLENIWQMHPTWGMVQACVGQKLVKINNFLQVFTVSNSIDS